MNLTFLDHGWTLSARKHFSVVKIKGRKGWVSQNGAIVAGSVNAIHIFEFKIGFVVKVIKGNRADFVRHSGLKLVAADRKWYNNKINRPLYKGNVINGVLFI